MEGQLTQINVEEEDSGNGSLHKRVQYTISQDTHYYYFLWSPISLLQQSGSYYSFFHNVSTELPSFWWDTQKKLREKTEVWLYLALK